MKISAFKFSPRCLLIAMCLFFLTSCVAPETAFAPIASKEEADQARAANIAKDRSVVYIFRTYGAYDKFFETYIDDVFVVKTVEHSFTRIELNPGSHCILSKIRGSGKPNESSSLCLCTESGGTYYVLQDWHRLPSKLGWPATVVYDQRALLTVPLPDETGARLLNGCKLLLDSQH